MESEQHSPRISCPDRQAPGEEIVIAMFVTFRDGNLWI
jgi:hypothetical protein